MIKDVHYNRRNSIKSIDFRNSATFNEQKIPSNIQQLLMGLLEVLSTKQAHIVMGYIFNNDENSLLIKQVREWIDYNPEEHVYTIMNILYNHEYLQKQSKVKANVIK